MKQANKGYNSKLQGQDSNNGSDTNTRRSRARPIGSTHVVLPSTSKTKFAKPSHMGVKKKTKPAHPTDPEQISEHNAAQLNKPDEMGLKKKTRPGKTSDVSQMGMKKKNSSVQSNDSNVSKRLTKRINSDQKKSRLKNKTILEEEEMDDRLLREALRRDMNGESDFARGFKKNNWSSTYEDVRRQMLIEENASPREAKGTELKVVESQRKSAWVDGRENNLVRPSSSEKSVQAWVLTDLEGNPDKTVHINVDGPDEPLLDESVDDGSEFDTDLEDDYAGNCHYDESSNEIYERVCRKKGIIPVSSIADRLSETEILIPHHGLGPEGAKAFACALMANTYVETVDLTDNDLQPEGGIAFSFMLRENIYITDLNLSENFLHAPGGIAISKALAVNSSIKRLSLKGNHLTDKVAVVLAETLKENRTLAELDLSYNEFGETGGLYIGAGLSLNYGLKVVSLKWNSICGKGAVSIAHALSTNESLTSLDLSWNGLGYTGALALSTNLPNNDCLKHLDLKNNRIRENGVMKLAPAFAQHPCIHEIRLGMNPIGPGGVEAVFDAVTQNPKIKHVGLEDISIPMALMPMVEDLIEERGITVISDLQTMKSIPETPKAGLEILMEFLDDNALRLKDMFFQFDKDHSGDITRQEFKNGLKEMGILMDSKQLDTLITDMDTDKNDTIDYKEILGGHRLMKENKRRQTMAQRKSAKGDTRSLFVPELDSIKTNLISSTDLRMSRPKSQIFPIYET